MMTSDAGMTFLGAVLAFAASYLAGLFGWQAGAWGFLALALALGGLAAWLDSRDDGP